jgi:PAS domain S-box-containing protein
MFTGEQQDCQENDAVKLLHLAQRRFSDLIRSLPVGIVIADQDGVIEAVNYPVVDLLGYSEDELKGKNIDLLLRSTPWEVGGSLKEWFRANREETIELEAKAKNDDIVPIDLSIRNLDTGGKDRAVILIQDVTERFLANRLKQEFLQMIHHDIRSPLSALVMFLDSLETSDSYGALNEKGRERLSMAKNNVERVLLLVAGLLELDRLQSGLVNFAMESVSVQSVLSESLDSVREQADAKGIDILLDVADLEVIVDKTRIVQVMVNLVSNAIAYSTPGRPIKLSAKGGTESVFFAVQDSGPGVPPDVRERIFDRFSRGTNNDNQGYGLGLAISKEIIKQHKGAIGLEDAPDGGSIFWFCIPRAVADS